MAHHPHRTTRGHRASSPLRASSSSGTASLLDEFHARVLLGISRQLVLEGFAFVPVGFGECSFPGCDCTPDGDSWTYTIGLAAQGMPELVVVGLAPAHAHELVRGLYHHHTEVAPVAVGEEHTLGGVSVKVADVPPEWLAYDLDRMAFWLNHYAPGRTELTIPPIGQVLFADGNGRFPDDPRCDPLVAEMQPLLAADPFSYPARPDGGSHRRTSRRSAA
jgi:hypothetical protein